MKVFLFLLLACSCLRVDTNPTVEFEQVSCDIAQRTCYTPSWCKDPCITSYLNQELDLQSAISLALLNNPNLASIYETLGIAKAQLAQSKLLQNPIYALAWRFSTRPSVTDLVDMAIFQNFLEALLIPQKKKLAEVELEATKAMVSCSVLEVIAKTKIAFYSLQAHQKLLQMQKLMMKGAHAQYEAARRLEDAGNTRELDVAHYQIRYEQSKVKVANLEVEVLKAREDLNILLGLWGREITWTIAPSLPSLQEKIASWAQVESCAIANSFDLQAAKFRLCAAATDFGIETSRILFPQFDLGVSSEREDSIWYVGPAFGIGLPIFDFGKAISATARSQIMMQWKAYTALAVEIRSLARRTRIKLLDAHRHALYYQEIVVPTATKILDLTLLQHNAMQIGVFELIDAKMNELEQQMLATDYLKDYLVAQTKLDILLNGHMLGGGE